MDAVEIRELLVGAGFLLQPCGTHCQACIMFIYGERAWGGQRETVGVKVLPRGF